MTSKCFFLSPLIWLHMPMIVLILLLHTVFEICLSFRVMHCFKYSSSCEVPVLITCALKLLVPHCLVNLWNYISFEFFCGPGLYLQCLRVSMIGCFSSGSCFYPLKIHVEVLATKDNWICGMISKLPGWYNKKVYHSSFNLVLFGQFFSSMVFF